MRGNLTRGYRWAALGALVFVPIVLGLVVIDAADQPAAT